MKRERKKKKSLCMTVIKLSTQSQKDL